MSYIRGNLQVIVHRVKGLPKARDDTYIDLKIASSHFKSKVVHEKTESPVFDHTFTLHLDHQPDEIVMLSLWDKHFITESKVNRMVVTVKQACLRSGRRTWYQMVDADDISKPCGDIEVTTNFTPGPGCLPLDIPASIAPASMQSSPSPAPVTSMIPGGPSPFSSSASSASPPPATSTTTVTLGMEGVHCPPQPHAPPVADSAPQQSLPPPAAAAAAASSSSFSPPPPPYSPPVYHPYQQQPPQYYSPPQQQPPQAYNGYPSQYIPQQPQPYNPNAYPIQYQQPVYAPPPSNMYPNAAYNQAPPGTQGVYNPYHGGVPAGQQPPQPAYEQYAMMPNAAPGTGYVVYTDKGYTYKS